MAEVDHIARSIHRWIITKSRMWTDGPAVYEATFTTIQAARGKRSAERRWGTTNAERIEGFIND